MFVWLFVFKMCQERMTALKALREFYNRLGDEFVILLPETIPFLAEVLEGTGRGGVRGRSSARPLTEAGGSGRPARVHQTRSRAWCSCARRSSK